MPNYLMSNLLRIYWSDVTTYGRTFVFCGGTILATWLTIPTTSWFSSVRYVIIMLMLLKHPRRNLFLVYKVIHKPLWDLRPLRYSSRDGHAGGEHVNRGRDTPSFCPNLQVLDMSTLGEAADINPVIKFLPHTCNVCGRNLITGLTSAASPRVDISSTCMVGQKIEMSLPLLTCSPSAWPSRLLYRRGRKSRRDLWITLIMVYHPPIHPTIEHYV